MTVSGQSQKLKVITYGVYTPKRKQTNKQTKKHLSLLAWLSLCDQIAEVEYFELVRRRDGGKNRLPCVSICGRPVTLQVCHGFVCNFIAPQIKFAFGVHSLRARNHFKPNVLRYRGKTMDCWKVGHMHTHIPVLTSLWKQCQKPKC